MGIAVGWGLLTFFGYQQDESLRAYAAQGWAVDAPVYYPPSYHLIAIPLIIAVICGRRFIVAAALAMVYLFLQVFVLYRYFQQCIFGEQTCLARSVDGFTLLFWSASVIVPIVFASLIYLVVFGTSKRRVT